MSTPYKINIAYIQGQGLSTRLAWARVFLGFVCLWHILGNLIQGASSGYSEMLAKNAAEDNLIKSQQKAQNLKVNESILSNQSNQTPVSIDPYNDQPSSPFNIPVPAKPLSVLPAATSTGKAYIGGYRTLPDTAPKTGSMVTAAPPTATWNDNTTVLRGSRVIQLAYFKTQLLALTNDGTLWSSSDGISWSINFDPLAHTYTYDFSLCSGSNNTTVTPVIGQIAVLGSLLYATITGAALCLTSDLKTVIRQSNQLDEGIYVSSNGGHDFSQVFESKGDNFNTCVVTSFCPGQAGIGGVAAGNSGVIFQSSNQHGIYGSSNLFTLGYPDPIGQGTSLVGLGGASIIPLGNISPSSNDVYVRINGGLYRVDGVSNQWC